MMKMRFSSLILAAVLGLGALGVQAQTGAAAAVAAAAQAEYRLGAGDVVRVVVYQNPDLTKNHRLK